VTQAETATPIAPGEMWNAFDVNAIDQLAPRARDIVERRRRVLGPAYRLQYARPAEFVRGEGVWLYDADGNRYLDAYNNVPSVGHCHPRVVAAQNDQTATLNTNTRYLDSRLVDYAERLLATHSESLDNVMFTCTGSEAVDLALRVARYHTDGEGVIISSHAYHGITAAAAAISPTLGKHVPLGHTVRTVTVPFGLPAEAVAAHVEAQVCEAIEDLERHGIALSAFIVDTLLTSDGLLADPPGFLVPAVAAVRAAGGVFIADEVQPGFGRTGEHMWGYQRHGIDPDIAVMGKPMGNGMPIAGMAVRSDVVDRFGRDTRYFNTFGGNTVSIAAAGAVLDVIEDEGLIARAGRVGAALRARITESMSGRPEFVELRGAGLYLGLELAGDGTRDGKSMAGAVVNAMRDRHVLISAMGIRGNTLKIRPPLVFDDAAVDVFMTAFDGALGEVLA
jgi:4-aminobutyrate aminotransferase-like enzyme